MITSRLIALAALMLTGCTVQPRPATKASAACSLNASELDERKVLLRELTKGVVERRELSDGLAFRFDPGSGVIQRLARLVELESDCCQFLTFKIVAEREQGPVWLEVTGPKDAQRSIREYFDRS